MGRYYKLSKSISDEAKETALSELKAKDTVKKAEITEIPDKGVFLLVETTDGEYSDVMSAAVNIFNRVAGGCALSFERFAVE
ncbi:MAG: hypothetical protein ACI39W_06070 [Brotaphodocola sp.]